MSGPLREQHEVMIVDDNPNNLRLLEDMLLSQGHAVRSFPLGRLALAAAKKSPPDLILLDINMPEMNGYEVCVKFKEDEVTRQVPVIFLSALNDVKDKIRAFQVGAVDYVSKPFQFEEVQARVDTQLRIHTLQRQLLEHNEHLEEVVQQRTHELEAANANLRLLDQAKSEFLQLISHELRTPLNGLLGSFELMLLDMPEAMQDGEMRQAFEKSRARILSIVEDALLLTEVDTRRTGAHGEVGCESLRLTAKVHRAAAALTELLEERDVTLILPPAQQDAGTVPADRRLMLRGLRALLETAVLLTERGKAVAVTAEPFHIYVTAACGHKLPEDALGAMFDVFGAAASRVAPLDELGLAPTVAGRLLRMLGATLSVRTLGSGCTLRFEAVWPESAQPLTH
jgi:DNA-binding response OmpR family regulator